MQPNLVKEVRESIYKHIFRAFSKMQDDEQEHQASFNSLSWSKVFDFSRLRFVNVAVMPSIRHAVMRTQDKMPDPIPFLKFGAMTDYNARTLHFHSMTDRTFSQLQSIVPDFFYDRISTEYLNKWKNSFVASGFTKLLYMSVWGGGLFNLAFLFWRIQGPNIFGSVFNYYGFGEVMQSTPQDTYSSSEISPSNVNSYDDTASAFLSDSCPNFFSR